MKFQSVPQGIFVPRDSCVVPHLLCTFLFVQHYYSNQAIEFILPHSGMILILLFNCLGKLSFGLWMLHWLYSVQHDHENDRHTICIYIKPHQHKDILEFQKVNNGTCDVFHDTVSIPPLPKRSFSECSIDSRKVTIDRRSFVPLPLFNDFVQKVHDTYPESTQYFNKVELVKHLMAADNDHDLALQRIHETMVRIE
jgi:hypothetical protein